jgi:hypothetical protein
MAYGTVKVDNITFDNGGVDQNIQVKDLFESTTSGLTVTGTISGQRIEAVSGVITTVSGTNLTYTTAGVQNISGGTLNYSSGIFASGTQTNPSIAFSGDVDTGFYNPTPNQIGITTAGGERVRIQEDGDVGIGTTNPVAKLHVAENSSAPGVLITQAGAGTALTVSGASVFSSTVTATTFSGNVVGNLTGTASAIADNTVTSAKIVDGTIVNADVNASAAIAGTKISPNFGSQNVVTTGTSTAASLIPTGSSVPTNGVYLPAANSVGISTNGTQKLLIDSSGNIEFSGTGIKTITGRRLAATVADGVFSIFGGDFTTNTGANIELYGGSHATSANLVILDADEHRFRAANGTAERMRLDSSGRLGLGTSSPQTLLHLSSSGVGAKLRIASTAGGTASFEQNHVGLELVADTITATNKYYPAIKFGSTDADFTTTNPKFGAAITAEATENYNSDTRGGTTLAFWTAPNDPGASGSLQERMSITQAGNVGIGTTSPERPLHVYATTSHVATVESDQLASNIRYINSTGNTVYAGSIDGNNFYWSIGGSERARIDSSGRLLVGTSTAINNNTLESISTFGLYRFAASTAGPFLNIGKSRSATTGTNTIVLSGDALGTIAFSGADNSSYVNSAWIRCEVDGTPGTDDMPGRLVFSTTADGASSPTERMRIRSDGNIGIGGAGAVSVTLYNQGAITGSTVAYGNYTSSTIQSDVTSIAYGYRSQLSTAAASFTAGSVVHYGAQNCTAGAGSTVTGQYGFLAESALGTTSSAQITNVFGFRGDIASATGRWNFWANGTAPNYFAGDVRTNTVVTVRAVPANSNVTATATAASLLDGLRTGTPAANINLTLPTGANMDDAFQELQNNQSFEWSVINRAAATHVITVVANTTHTVVGNMDVAAASSGRFLTRKTAANTFITYRIA